MKCEICGTEITSDKLVCQVNRYNIFEYGVGNAIIKGQVKMLCSDCHTAWSNFCRESFENFLEIMKCR